MSELDAVRHILREQTASGIAVVSPTTTGRASRAFHALLHEYLSARDLPAGAPLEATDSEQLADQFALETGQRRVWQAGFQLNAGRGYFDAEPAARTSLKLAFMHAADHVSTQSDHQDVDDAVATDSSCATGEEQQLNNCLRSLQTDARLGVDGAAKVRQERRWPSVREACQATR